MPPGRRRAVANADERHNAQTQTVSRHRVVERESDKNTGGGQDEDHGDEGRDDEAERNEKDTQSKPETECTSSLQYDGCSPRIAVLRPISVLII